MAKSNNQKAKILYLEKMLRETGEHHAISMQTILANLMEHGIRAERKSIYDDVEVLREFGMDIRYTRERPGGYYLAGQQGAEQPSVQAENANVSTLEKVQEKAETKSVDISGYQALLKNSAGTIKKEMRLLCTGVAQAEIRDFFGEDAEYKIKENGDLMVTAQLPENSKLRFLPLSIQDSLRLADGHGRRCAYPETKEIRTGVQRLSEITGKGI